jgi:hypothetical protein
MGTKKSNLVVLAVLLAALPMYVLAGCKKKVQSTNAKSPEMFNEEQQDWLVTLGNEQVQQSNQLSSYPSSEDDEEYEEPDDEDEEYEEEPDDNPDYSDDEQPDDEEEYPYEEPNDYPDEELNDSWL